MSRETIYAPATGPGRAAIAIVRISGPGVVDVVTAVAGVIPAPRQARFAPLRDPTNGEIIDRGIVLFFPGPGSVTGEDYAEFQVHGGAAVVEALLRVLAARPGFRIAEAGEFVRRGFRNGKVDLSQAEALADLIDAQTESQRRQALRLAGGALRREVERWRGRLLEALADMEAALDFSDESETPETGLERLQARLALAHMEMRRALAQTPASERMREGFVVLILGPPNAGKSTLLNALARRDLAIVSPRAGTTRDMIEAHLDIEGLPVTFVDTAGLRAAADEIERIGVDRTIARAASADLILWLSDEDTPPPDEIAGSTEIFRVFGKADLKQAPAGRLAICAPSGEGLPELLASIATRACAAMGNGDSALFARARHRAAVLEASDALDDALDPGDKAPELRAEDLRRAARALGRIVGVIDVEEILGAIFSRFCIGK
jgi:tRNA modification GTPase